MSAVAWFLAAAHAAVIAVLVRAGAAKLAAPAVAAAAVGELKRSHGPVPTAWIRALGVVEMTAAIATVLPVLRLAALMMVLVLGLGFAAAGAGGMARGTGKPCGCFGAESGRPLGPANIAIGAVFTGFTVLALALRGTANDASFGSATALLAVTLSAGWLLVGARQHLRTVLRHATNGGERTA
ncbi:MauE/DoxX family redox-associated membrane protein [Streptomyces cyslabdanicus]|uniref:MauE/DoxX family redox-associated membrane protein n=1 Tax=Streptomyces cyslabdanicus TaxID=1470456 RepID=UPI00404431D0